ncbi:MAG: DUF2807 domain-containing protein [Cyclobacteriaceae bacterium]|nr:DUF2807 domain-containing protein [Cyclobacteriaceae bacterium]
MRNRIYLTAIALLIYVASNAQESETRNVGKFNEVHVSEAIDVFIEKGGTEQVRVEVDGVDLDRVGTGVTDGRLKVEMLGNNRGGRVKVYITYVEIRELRASSAASIFSKLISADKLELSASSAGLIDITVQAKELEVSVSSSGEVELKGKSDFLHVNASSAGEVDAFDMEINRVSAHASSAGSIKINVLNEIEAKASSGGSIKYKGNPSRSNTNSSSGGSVRKY